MLIIDSIDMHKIHCVNLQVSKKKVYPRNNGTIGIISNVVRVVYHQLLSFSPRFRPSVTIFLNDNIICRRQSHLHCTNERIIRYKSPYKTVREKYHHHVVSNSIDLAGCLQISLTVQESVTRRKIWLIRVSFLLFLLFFFRDNLYYLVSVFSCFANLKTRSELRVS